MPRLPAADTLPASCLRVLALLLEDRLAGRPPCSVRSLASRLSCTPEPVHRCLARLRDHGLVAWEPHKARTVRLTCRFEAI